MNNVQALMENEEVTRILSENSEILEATMNASIDFKENTLKPFIVANAGEFLAENLTETVKNINVFVEAATSQYLAEITSYNSNFIVDQEEIVENEMAVYL